MTIDALTERVAVAYRASLVAQAVYENALCETYGTAQASEARYDYKRNAATPYLAAVRQAYYTACESMHAAVLDLRSAERTGLETDRYTFVY